MNAEEAMRDVLAARLAANQAGTEEDAAREHLEAMVHKSDRTWDALMAARKALVELVESEAAEAS